jgi:hypothetical protein
LEGLKLKTICVVVIVKMKKEDVHDIWDMVRMMVNCLFLYLTTLSLLLGLFGVERE